MRFSMPVGIFFACRTRSTHDALPQPGGQKTAIPGFISAWNCVVLCGMDFKHHCTQYGIFFPIFIHTFSGWLVRITWEIYILKYIYGIYNSPAITEQPRQGRGVDWEQERAGNQGYQEPGCQELGYQKPGERIPMGAPPPRRIWWRKAHEEGLRSFLTGAYGSITPIPSAGGTGGFYSLEWSSFSFLEEKLCGSNTLLIRTPEFLDLPYIILNNFK